MEEESPISKDADLSSDLLGDTTMNKKKKTIIISSIIGVSLLIILIVIIIIVVYQNNEKDKNKEKKNEPNEIKGEINCIYNIYTTEESIKLISAEFNPKIKIEIVIDEKNLGFIREYKFNQIGNTLIKINLYEDIDMDNMFKGIHNLLQVEKISLLNSENERSQILSMKSTFEGCDNLFNFTIINFNGENLKSMHKLFLRSGISEYTFINFTTPNLEDISYMFSYSNIEIFEPKGLDFSKVKNISHLFEECNSLLSIETKDFKTENVQDMSYMFKSVSSMYYLDLSNFDTSNVL